METNSKPGLLEIRGGLVPGPERPSTDPEESTRWEQVVPRRISLEQWRRFEEYASEIFAAFGLRLDTPATRTTPLRFLKALYDSTAGYEGDAKLLTTFPTECGKNGQCEFNQIVEGPIPFYALCEHHVLPFHGFAHVGYVSHQRIIGISKLTRLVRLFARRFTVQERMGQEIADTLVAEMEPHGVAVHLEAVHLCTQMRGVREEHSRTVTTFWRGLYNDDRQLRQEFLGTVRSRNPWT